MDTPMKGFFDGADIMAEARASTSAVHRESLQWLLFLHLSLVLLRRVPKLRELVSLYLFLLRFLLLRKELLMRVHLKLGVPFLPHVSDPLIALSWAVKDGSFLVVTPSSIPNFATHEPNVDLSSDEGSKEILKDSKDEPVMKKRVSNSDEDDGGRHETEAMGMCLLPLLDLLFSLFFITSRCNSLIILYVHSLSHRCS